MELSVFLRSTRVVVQRALYDIDLCSSLGYVCGMSQNMYTYVAGIN